MAPKQNNKVIPARELAPIVKKRKVIVLDEEPTTLSHQARGPTWSQSDMAKLLEAANEVQKAKKRTQIIGNIN
jgi:hypothetical protein